MIEFRKVVVFLFVTILLFYMIGLLCFIKKKWQYKTYTFVILIGGISLINIATFFDMIENFLNYEVVHNVIKISFTLGAIIYIIGVILWSNFTKMMLINLEKMASTDSMTGVLNRSGIEKIYDSMIKRKNQFYVIVCDLDGTKRINDTYGHIEGDNYIYITTKIITNVVGSKGYVSRIGGDEFVILLQSQYKEIKKIISMIKKQVCGLYPDESTGISLGYALFPNDGLTLKELIKSADERMYENKKITKLFKGKESFHHKVYEDSSAAIHGRNFKEELAVESQKLK